MKEKDHIVGILIGEGPSEEARSLPCPYCVVYTSSGTTVVGVFSLPEKRRWWLKWIEIHPELAGLTRAEVLFTQH